MVDNHIQAMVKRTDKSQTEYYTEVSVEHKETNKTAKEIFSAVLNRLKRLGGILRNACPTFKSERAARMASSCAISCVLVAIVVVLLASVCSIGYTVTVKGQEIGTLRNRKDYESVLSEINKEISYVAGSEFSPAEEPVIRKGLIPKNSFTKKEDLKEQLKATSSDMVPAYAIYSGDEIVVALANEDAALAVLNSYKDSFVEGKDLAIASFCDSVTVSRRFVPKDALKTEDGAAKVLKNGRMINYELKEGESLSDVADCYGVTVNAILQSNAITNPNKPEPGIIKIPTGKPLLYVKTIEKQSIEESIPFNTIEKEDPERYEGNIFVEQEGSEGTRVVEAYVTSINGIEMSRNILSDNVLSTAVDKIVCKGTKERPASVGTGLMATPASGTLTSRYGSRWGRNHTGIDIAAPTGTAIYAADNGVVTYAAYNNGGYGYMIQIDHGNDIKTYYAHCSELLVQEGNTVAKGDLIAKVGNTGRSTGAHLHFEVRVNGSPADPSAYLAE